jgi:arginyl-tRNA synthetase
MNVLQLLQARIHAALAGLTDDPARFAGMVKPAQDPRLADYQANCAMPLGKLLGRKPQEVARDIVQRLQSDDILESSEVAGPGFINLRLRSSWLAEQLQRSGADPRLGVSPTSRPRTFVLDFGSPNVAKPMHVGHLRSTIIGDCLARLLRFLGHRVITDNHLGDWGEQFGILLYGYKHYRDDKALEQDPVRELVRLYVLVRNLMKAGDSDDADDLANPVAVAAREETARLHAGDPENLALWRQFMPWCLEEISRIYRRLDVQFDQTLGESFYNPMLAGVVQDLLDKGVASICDDGSVAIFVSENEPPSRIRKKDGAFTYTATDLATIEYRIEHWHPDAILYVVDARQALHFKNLFEAARRWGYDHVDLEHLSFGAVLGNDRKPIKTREGSVVELGQLLDEAAERAGAAYETSYRERQERGEDLPELGPDERNRLAEVVGIGAVKYADLSQNRTSDYLFSWEKMLAMDGNTAAYMQYAYARNRSIFRRGAEDSAPFRSAPPLPSLEDSNERVLGIQLLRLSEALESAAAEFKPNVLTGYLWEVARAYSGFFQNCSVLKAESPELRRSRLFLCDLTARTIALGLELLGIHTVEQM